MRNIADCRNAMMYIADVRGYGVIVYDLRRNVAWKTHNNLYHPNPEYSTITVKGTSFTQLAGVIGMALSSPRRANGPSKANFPAKCPKK